MKHFISASKRAVCALLVVLLLTAGLTVAYAVEPADGIIKGKFTMETFDGFDPGEQTYYYSDSYFETSGTKSNAHLRTMSAALVFQLRGRSQTPVETFGATLKNTGFKDITAYDLDRTSLDTFGMLLAHKTVGGKELIAVALRGDKYEHEMAANLISDTEGDIKAFADAEALVESRVGTYLSEHGITSAKYWVTGYSRSGAVANLFGRELNKDTEKFATTADDIFVYTFEAPNGSADDTVYDNIHNIIDRRDLVTYIYPQGWGLYNNGTPEYIGDTDDKIMIKMLDLFSESHMADVEEMNTSDYLTELVSFLSEHLDRATFSEKLGTPLAGLMNIYYDLDEEQRSTILPFFQKTLNDMMQDDMFLSTVLMAVFDPTSQESVENLAALLITYLDNTAAEIGKPVDDESFETLKSSVNPILAALLPVVAADMTAEIEHTDGTDATSAPVYHIMTLVGNLMPILKNHFNYNLFNELKALDSYYDDEAMYGDMNRDKKITIDDATIIQRAAAEFVEFTDEEAQLADVNNDGRVSVLDVTCVQKYLAEYKTGLGKTGRTAA